MTIEGLRVRSPTSPPLYDVMAIIYHQPIIIDSVTEHFGVKYDNSMKIISFSFHLIGLSCCVFISTCTPAKAAGVTGAMAPAAAHHRA